MTRDEARGQDPRRRARLQDVDRTPRGILVGRQPAGRLHDLQRGPDPLALESVLQRRQVAPHHRQDVGIDRRCRRPFVFLALAQDVHRKRNVHARQMPAQIVADAQFMFGEGVGMEQADGHRRHLMPAELIDQQAEGVLVEGLEDFARGGDALGHLEAQEAFDQRRRFFEEQVEKLRDAQAPDLEDVAKAFGRDQRRAGAAPLQNRIGGDRRAMGDFADALAARVGHGFQQRRDAVQHALFVIGRRGGDLARPDGAVAIHQDDVGKGSADVGADPQFTVAIHSSLNQGNGPSLSRRPRRRVRRPEASRAVPNRMGAFAALKPTRRRSRESSSVRRCAGRRRWPRCPEQSSPGTDAGRSRVPDPQAMPR
ncbi:MAG: hypothetical protein BWZ08_02707 [candidate division BRC1 bacterium ADurb.BinA292]|nr:MAG: hypothetical protein BWZ08_02707 [candidate division BRC1 bacterium ADurb.BinA292]